MNLNCGSTNTKNLKKRVLEEGADIGIALDGDADRVIVIDEKGNEVDGNLLLALIIKNLNERKLLNNKSVVSTIMANIGLEKYLSGIGLNLTRTNVGDRYLAEGMREANSNIGGEPSGHIIMSNFGKTGDGLIASLQVLSIMCASGKPVSEIVNLFDLYPQKNITIPLNGKNTLTDSEIQKITRDADDLLRDDGRVVVRKSGTEPIMRIMVESLDSKLADSVAGKLSDSIKHLMEKSN